MKLFVCLFLIIIAGKIIALSAGENHNLILTSAGLYACGANTYGQLGIGEEEIKEEDSIHLVSVRDQKSKLQGLEAKQVEMVESGGDFCYALTTSGEVYSWGLNVCGNLGHGDLENKSVPTLVECLSPETQSKKAKFNMKRSKSREVLTQQNPNITETE